MKRMHDAYSLVDTHGNVQFGQFHHSLQNVNGRDARYRNAFGHLANRFQKHFHYKQFQYFGVVSDQLLVGCALADTAYLGVAFFYIFNMTTGDIRELTWRSPLSAALSMSPSVTDGHSHYKQGAVSIEMGYEKQGEALRKTLRVDTPEVTLSASMEEPASFEPMSICTRAGVSGFVYANKVAARPVTGTLKTATDDVCFDTLNAWGHHDFSAGYMRRETFWNWACLSGPALTDTSTQVATGLNVSCGVNETSWSENCFWVDDRLLPLQGTHFEYDRGNLLAPWHIRSTDEQLKLDFTPAGSHREKMNLGLFASNFNQIFGTFNGVIHLPEPLQYKGKRILIKNMPGFVEEQYAKW